MPNSPINNLLLQRDGLLQTGLVEANGGQPAKGVPYGLFNVLSYGADPSGVGDSTAAIQAAVDAAGVDGGTVWVPPGTYTLSAAADVSSSTGVRVSGAGEGSIIKAVASTVGALFNVTGSNVVFERLTIDGSYVSGTSTVDMGLVSLVAASNVQIQGCWIKNSRRNGVRSFGACVNVLIADNVFSNNYCCIHLFADSALNTSPQAFTIRGNFMLEGWEHGGGETGGLKISVGSAVSEVSSGHLVSGNYINNSGALLLELWGGGGIIGDSVVSDNVIISPEAGAFGISLNNCKNTTVSGNTVNLTNGFVGLEVANECTQVLLIGNAVSLYDAAGLRTSAGGIGINNNAGPGPVDIDIIGNVASGGERGIHLQGASKVRVMNNRISDFSDVMCYIQGATQLTISHNTFSSNCASMVYVDGSTVDLADIDIGYNTFVGEVGFRTVWGGNSGTSRTLSNLHFHHNDATNSTIHAGGDPDIDSWSMDWDNAELANIIREDNYYFDLSLNTQWPDYTSPDVVNVQPFSPEDQEFSIPIATKFTFTVAASGSDQWFKIFSATYGLPLLVSLHVSTEFLGGDNSASSQTFSVSASPYGGNCGIMKVPDGDYNTGPLVGVIYDNPSSGAVQEIWLRFGPTNGGTVIVGGADFASSWITAPSVVTSAPTYGSNSYELAASLNHQSLVAQSMISDVFGGSEQASSPAAPPTNGFKIYAKDNGAGKTALYVRFATGAEQQIAIEP